MKSSSGAHFIALDHVRALAAFMVFSWHFMHGFDGAPTPFEGAPAFPLLTFLDEGHTGVALFMTLSGYLFARLLEGRRIDYAAFLTNRALRLLPLLFVVLALVGVERAIAGADLFAYAATLADGLWRPVLPNGGWSITIEFHFYVMLPLLLALTRRHVAFGFMVIAVAIALRLAIFTQAGEVQSVAYWTIFGRIDQFMFGILAARHRGAFARRHLVAAATFAIFAAFYWRFNALGGFYRLDGYPSPSALWIFLPTVEGVAYAALIAWYDGSFRPSAKGVSGFIGRLGAYSYSIYLLHFFVVFRAADFIDAAVMDISSPYVAALWALPLFALMAIPGWASYRFIETPFLRRRRRYILEGDDRIVAKEAAARAAL